MNERDVAHEIIVISVTYLFVGCGAWNDGILGFTPSSISRLAEYGAALLLGLEIASRLYYTKSKRANFWLVIALDAISVLTVLPGFLWVSIARLIRLVYAAGRLIGLLDRIACAKKNPVYLIVLYPFVVPLFAAVVFAVESRAKSSTIHNYIDALGVCFAFALSLGNVRPVSAVAMALCGVLFLIGIVCIGIATNALSSRYIRP